VRNARRESARGPRSGADSGVVYLLPFLMSAIVLSVLAGCSSLVINQDLPPSTVSPVNGSPIQHIVVIMQENRSFDNLFHGFPGADFAQTGVSNGVEVPLQSISLADPRDLDHSHPRWWKDWNHGAMDGFVQANANPPILPYSYVRQSDVEPYWTMASTYTLSDRMFQSNTGPSFVAHQYLIARQSGGVDENPSGSTWGCDAAPGSTAALIGPEGTDLPGVYPCFDYRTLADLLDARGVTWRYYAPGSADGYFVLSAYQAIRHIRFGEDWSQNVISPQTRVFTDIAAGHLAQVTWIVPDFTHSDHPGQGVPRDPIGLLRLSTPSARARSGIPRQSLSHGMTGVDGTITFLLLKWIRWAQASAFR
jgi:phospholipase C